MPKIQLPREQFEAIASDVNHPLFTMLAVPEADKAQMAAGRFAIDRSAPLPQVIAVAQNGGEVEEYPAWLELTEAQYDSNIPEYMPHATIEEHDGEGNVIATTPRKWSQWHDATHEHRQIRGKWYVGLNGFGRDMPASILAQLDAERYTILDTKGYRAVTAQESE